MPGREIAGKLEWRRRQRGENAGESARRSCEVAGGAVRVEAGGRVQSTRDASLEAVLSEPEQQCSLEWG